MVIFIFILNVMEGIRTIDADQIDLMKSMRAGRLYIARTVLFPAVVPWILASFRIGVGLALIGAVVGELIGSNRGLGWYIESSGGQARYHRGVQRSGCAYDSGHARQLPDRLY